eukprot:14145633-Heterocapsa_arctica.AAC.1
MELVVHLEEKIKAPGKALAQDNKEEDEKPVNIKEFRKAINMLKDMNQDLVKDNLEEARRTRDIIRDLADALTKKRAHSSGSEHSNKSEERKRRPKGKQAEKPTKAD